MLEQAHQIHPFLVIQVLIPLSKHGKHMHAPCTGRSSLFPNLCRRLCSEVTSWSCLLQSLLIKDAYIAKEQEYPTKDSLLFRTLLYHKYALGILAGKRILTPLRQETFNLPLATSKDKDLISASFTFVNSYSCWSLPFPGTAFYPSQDQSVITKKSVNTCSRNSLLNWNSALKQ